MRSEYKLSVFINCPFDREYRKFLRAIIFTVHDCGYIARSAQEINKGEVRLSKIFKIISECRIGIHDISRTELDRKTRLPRFNMPLELGMFFGAREYGKGKQKDKVCLILDRDPHRYQKFISDISGQDPSSHDGKIERLIHVVRNFLRDLRTEAVPGGEKISQRYRRFSAKLPAFCRQLGSKMEDLTFRDYTTFVAEWLKQHAYPKT